MSAILALAWNHDNILKDFKNDSEFTRVVQGFDLDGDNRIDSVEVLE